MKVKHLLPVARSANRGRVVPFGNKYGGRRRSSHLGLHEEHELYFAPLNLVEHERNNISCPSLDRRIGAALRLRLRYGGRRRSSHLGLNTEHLLRSHSVRSRER